MGREGLKTLARSIRAHPQFPAAAARATGDFIAWRARLGVLNKVVSSLARERILEHLLYLHYARTVDGGEHGATFERLASLSETRDQVGARAVRTTLRLAQIAGHVTLTRSPEDGRLRVYEPAEALLALVGEFYFIFLGVLEDLEPSFRVRQRIRSEPGFLRDMIARLGRAFLAGEPRAGSHSDPYLALLRLEGAPPIVATVVDCELRQLDLPAAPELARRFHVSASQTRAVLKNVETHGYIKIGPRGRLLDAQPLTDAYLAALSRSLAFMALYALETRFEAFRTPAAAD